MAINEQDINTIVVLAFFLLGFIPLILLAEYIIRPFRVKKLADKYGLKYKLQLGLVFIKGKRNIITGSIGENKVEIFDYAISHGYKPIYSHRSTQFRINNSWYKLKGNISGYFPIGKLNEILADIKKTKGRYPLPPKLKILTESASRYWRTVD